MFHSDKQEMKPLDYTLYNRVKAKFPPQPDTLILVSLAPHNLEKLEGEAYTIDKIESYVSAVGDHIDKLLPYALIGGFQGDDVSFHYVCREFIQEEDLMTGEVVSLSVGNYERKPVDLEAVKKDLQKLFSGDFPLGNT